MSRNQYLALKWAVDQAEKWHGYFTGDPCAERIFLRDLEKAKKALAAIKPTGPTRAEIISKHWNKP